MAVVFSLSVTQYMSEWLKLVTYVTQIDLLNWPELEARSVSLCQIALLAVTRPYCWQ